MMQKSRDYNHVLILYTCTYIYTYIFNSNYVLAVTASFRMKNFSGVSGITLHPTSGFSVHNPSYYF